MSETAADAVAVPAGGQHSDHGHDAAATDEIADVANIQAGAGQENLRGDQRKADVSADRQAGDPGKLKHKRVLKCTKNVRLLAGGEPIILRGKLLDDPGPLVVLQPGRRRWRVRKA